MEHFYRRSGQDFEFCFNVETTALLTTAERQTLQWLLAETFQPEQFNQSPFLSIGSHVIELGPRLNFETALSTNAVAICHACGLTKVTRVEKSRRYQLPAEINEQDFVRIHHDRMTECHYPQPLTTFETGVNPEAVYSVPLIKEGLPALQRINSELGLGMDAWDLQFYLNLFTQTFQRNPTNVECFQLGQANSEHSRHWFFKGKLIIDGITVPETLLAIIKSTLEANPANSVIAFKDNSSAIKGYDIWTIIPGSPGQCSPFVKTKCNYCIIFTAETHNFPCGVAPYPGAETGTGGRIRDVQATGRGGLVVAGTVGYCVGNLYLPNYQIPGEEYFPYPSNLATPNQILIEESNGASDYGDCFGEPVIQGFTRTFDQRLPNQERRGFVKPIMFTGGIGQMNSRHLEKGQPKKGLIVIKIGGPAYRIGMGGGGASSMMQGKNRESLDFNAVQRGNAEMEQKMNRVVRACVEMGDNNPLISIHDQGAGGPCNVITELVAPAGAKIEIRNITLGDQTLSVLEIWCAEYQERNALLIRPACLAEFQKICQREKVNCEVLGEITDDGQIILHDSQDNTTPVNLSLAKILGKMPQKTFTLEHLPRLRRPLELPVDLTVEHALQKVFALPTVGSKGFLVRKVDRSVTGLIARQQCCGPTQIPVADVAVIAQSHLGLTGAATAIGEQPIKMLVNPAAGARLAVGEALTNIVWAKLSNLTDIKCSANWMWAAKLPGEGALLYDAAVAVRDLMIKLGIAIDGGKDSLSMAARVGDEMVKAPGELVISAYATMPNINKVITPDLKKPGLSRLMLIDLTPGKNRLGGSALAQAYGQIGDQSPDVDDPELLKNAFLAVQELIGQNLILSGHDCSDGGLITTLIEMAMAGDCGILVRLDLDDSNEVIPRLFAEELRLVIEYTASREQRIIDLLNKFNLLHSFLGVTRRERKVSIYRVAEKTTAVLDLDLAMLRNWWEATSDRLEECQMNLELARQQAKTHNLPRASYSLSFEPVSLPATIENGKPKVAIIREEGSNGDREMTSAFFLAGFEPWDVTMTDLLNGVITLDQFRGLVFVGGFSYADVLDSAKGWAGIIRFNPKLNQMFTQFYQRPDTFSLGVCNGCQLMALLGWVPWQGLSDIEQPRFIRNLSERFESNWVTIKINPSPAIMFAGMENSILGIWVAHGEGRLHFPDNTICTQLVDQNLLPLVYVDGSGQATEIYPFNPNGSPLGIAGLCSPDGRHLAMMPHPERVFQLWQWPWLPFDWKNRLTSSPWLRMFQNARIWCEENY